MEEKGQEIKILRFRIGQEARFYLSDLVFFFCSCYFAHDIEGLWLGLSAHLSLIWDALSQTSTVACEMEGLHRRPPHSSQLNVAKDDRGH